MLFNLHHRYLTTDSARCIFTFMDDIDLPRTLSNNNGSNENRVYVFHCTICCSNRKISAADFYIHRHIQFIISAQHTVCRPYKHRQYAFSIFRNWYNQIGCACTADKICFVNTTAKNLHRLNDESM